MNGQETKIGRVAAEVFFYEDLFAPKIAVAERAGGGGGRSLALPASALLRSTPLRLGMTPNFALIDIDRRTIICISPVYGRLNELINVTFTANLSSFGNTPENLPH